MVAAYRIASVAMRTGLTADTIRAWERRYGIVTPERTPRGERRYREADVEKLQLVRAAVGLGHAISYVARLSNDEIKAIVEPRTRDSDLENSAAQRTVASVLDAVRAYHLASAVSLLGSAALFFAPHKLIVDVLVPLMRTVGDEWEAGRLSVAQEHFASHLVDGIIASVLRVGETSVGRTMLFLTPPNETHELGLHFAAALAASKGVLPIMLGASVPLDEVTQAASGSGASGVVVGATYSEDLAALASYVAGLRHALPAWISVSIGGHAATQIPAPALPEGVNIIETLAAFYRSLPAVSFTDSYADS